MKTKKLRNAFLNFGIITNLKNTFKVLLLFLFTMSSNGQNLGIEFECVGAGLISFNTAPDDTFNGRASWSNGIDFLMTPGYTLRWEGDNTWSVRDPNGPRFFYSNIDSALPSCSTVDWQIDPMSIGQNCQGVVVSCTIGSPEVCDGIDNDGDGDIDEDLTFITYYADDDGDGFGDPSDSISTCDGPPPGFVEDDTDCLDEGDGADTAYPGAVEVPFDTIDNDCDGEIDEDDDPPVVHDYCDDQNKKVLICHNGKTKCVSINAFDAHIAHGDTSGPCSSLAPEVPINNDTQDITEVNPKTFDIVSWPNPSGNFFNLRISSPDTIAKIGIQVLDITGKIVHNDSFDSNQQYQFGNKLQAGVYFVRIKQASNTHVTRMIKY